VLLLHGGADERIPVQQTEAFAEQLRSVGVTYRSRSFRRRRTAFLSTSSGAKSTRFSNNISAERRICFADPKKQGSNTSVSTWFCRLEGWKKPVRKSPPS